MNHVVLLGDSIFDNAAYTEGGPSVREQVQERLPLGWQVTLLAVDGSFAQDVLSQLARLPGDATHLILSAGGNDALSHSSMLGETAQSVAQVLDRLAEISASFQEQYHPVVQAVLSRGLPTALCTIYYPRFPEPDLQRAAVTALTVFNDVILRETFAAGTPLIDLRLVCTEDADYANPIEPSSVGGTKMAEVIARVLLEHDFAGRRTEVYV